MKKFENALKFFVRNTVMYFGVLVLLLLLITNFASYDDLVDYRALIYIATVPLCVLVHIFTKED